MRVTVRIASGPSIGRKIVLGVGQSLKVGRTEWADVAFPEDQRMSSLHFQVDVEPENVFVRDLKSTNGTSVNGKPIKDRTALANGDTVLAGRTEFTVQIDRPAEEEPRGARPPAEEPIVPLASPAEDEPDATRKPVVGGRRQASPPAAAPPGRPFKAVGHFTVEKCQTGLTLCRGQVDELAPADLAVLLAQHYPPYLMVDFNKFGPEARPALANPSYVFDWLEPTAAALASPWILEAQEYLEWPRLVEEGWGNDAVVCLFSQQDSDSLRRHLRQAVKTKIRGDGPHGVLGFCWPSVLAPLLMYFNSTIIQELMAAVDVILIEMPDLPITWQLYGSADLPRLLHRCGLRPEPEGSQQGVANRE